MADQYEHERGLIYQAASSQLGIVVATTEMQSDLGRLYAAYRRERDLIPKLEFRKSPWNPLGEIWIIKVAEVPKAPPGEPSEVPPPAIGTVDIDFDELFP